MFCPICKSEYVEGISVCKECDVPLVDKLPGEEQTENETQEINKDLKFEEVFVTANQNEIVFIKSLLDEAGIEYYLSGDVSNLFGALGDSIRLMIREDQVEETLELLKDLDLGSTSGPAENEES